MNDIATSPQPARDAAASAAEVPGVDVRDVRVTYPNGVTALEDVSFSLPAGAICGEKLLYAPTR